MESLVVTVIGKDRPGLVELVSAVVEEHGGDWVESRMSRLAGEFAGILRVSVPAAQADVLSEGLEGLRSDGLRVVVERGFEEAVEEGHVVLLELIGSDRPGIVHKISEALAARGVNVGCSSISTAISASRSRSGVLASESVPIATGIPCDSNCGTGAVPTPRARLLRGQVTIVVPRICDRE